MERIKIRLKLKSILIMNKDMIVRIIISMIISIKSTLRNIIKNTNIIKKTNIKSISIKNINTSKKNIVITKLTLPRI